MRVAHNIHTTDKLVALEFPNELELGNADFWGGWKTEEPGENPRGKDKIQQQTQPTMTPGLGFELGSYLGGERDQHCATP